MYTLTVVNNGPDAATELFLADILPPDVTFVSVTSAQGSCTFSPSTVTCALNTINKGTSVTVEITTTPTQTGAIENSAYVAGNVYDPEMNNNSVVMSSTVVDINPAIESIISLISRITMLVDQEILNPGQGKSLITLLEAAENHVERDRAIPAINQIHAFMNHITAFVRASVLTQSQGEALLTMAENIIVHLTQQHQAFSP
jgi:uncharacterized repeat protein (TIGR01451 family)